MVSSILFSGGEDIDFTNVGNGGIASAVGQGVAMTINSGLWSPCYTVNTFRPGYARHGFGQLTSNPSSTQFLRTLQFSTGTANTTSSNFWTSARLYAGPSGQSFQDRIMRFSDSSGIPRLRISAGTSTSWPNATIIIETMNTAGTAITLATSVNSFGTNSPTIPDKIDVFVNYAVAGQFTVYCNGAQVVTYSGDITTNGVTSLAFVDFGLVSGSNGGSSNVWSEVIVATRDTRNMSLVTQAPIISTGNTQAWTSNALILSTTVAVTSFPNATTAHSANDMIFFKFTSAATGQITAATVGLSSAIVGAAQMAVYTDSGASFPATLMATSSNIANVGSGISTFTFSPPPVITANSFYWLAYKATAAYTTTDNNTNTSIYLVINSLFSFPASPGGFSTISNKSLILTYSLGTPYVGANSYDSAGPDSSATANQLEEYQISPAIPTGNFSVVSVIAHASSTVGSTGPTKYDYAVRVGNNDFLSSDIIPGTAWATIPYHWDTNPNTAASWQTAEIIASNNTFNIGFKSIT